MAVLCFVLTRSRAELDLMSYYIPETLEDIAEQVRRGQHPAVTVRMLLSWFGGQRRKKSRVRRIREAFNELKIKAESEIEGAYIDGLVSFLPAEQSNSALPESVPDIGELPVAVADRIVQTDSIGTVVGVVELVSKPTSAPLESAAYGSQNEVLK